MTGCRIGRIPDTRTRSASDCTPATVGGGRCSPSRIPAGSTARWRSSRVRTPAPLPHIHKAQERQRADATRWTGHPRRLCAGKRLRQGGEVRGGVPAGPGPPDSPFGHALTGSTRLRARTHALGACAIGTLSPRRGESDDVTSSSWASARNDHRYSEEGATRLRTGGDAYRRTRGVRRMGREPDARTRICHRRPPRRRQVEAG
jgi:hypothetical protein